MPNFCDVPLGDTYPVPVESSFSRKKSHSSAIAFVTPHEISALRPARNRGIPGTRNPATFRPSSLVRCAMYHRAGAPSFRCVSFSSIAPPLALRIGAMAKQFDPEVPETSGHPIMLSIIRCMARISANTRGADDPVIAPNPLGGAGTCGFGGGACG